MITVNDLIKQLEKFRDIGPDLGKAEIMLEFDHGVALEFHTAELTVCSQAGNNGLAKFLIFRPYTTRTAKRVEIEPKIFI